MENILLVARLILAAIFAVAGIAKFYDLEGSKKAVKDFGVPEILAKPFSILLPVAEVVIAVLLIFVQTSYFGIFSFSSNDNSTYGNYSIGY